MNKKAIELSVNFVVTIILSLIIFSLGFVFIYDVMKDTSKLKKMTLDDIDAQISDLMCSSAEKVCLQKSTLELKRGDFEIITAKVLNADDSILAETGYTIYVLPGVYQTPNNAVIDYPNTENDIDNIIVFPNERSAKIKKNEAESFAFGFEIPRQGIKSGTYVFNLKICRGSDIPVTCAAGDINKYDKIHKIYVKVR